MKLRVIICSILLAVVSSTSSALTINVAPDGSGDYPNIQLALYAATPGDTVLLGDGVFRGDGNRDISVFGNGVVLASASGYPESCVIDCEGSSSDFHNGLTITGPGDEATIVGIAIKNGCLTDGDGGIGGGAVRILGCSPTFINCLFENNVGFSGGAILARDNANPRFESCRFLDNAYGAIWGWKSGIELIDCTFRRNFSNTKSACTFALDHYPFTVEGCLFESNNGGAIRVFDIGATSACPVEIRDNEFHDNYNTNSYSGSALDVSLYHGIGTIERCLFVGNSSENSLSGTCYLSGNCELIECTFYENFGRGGAIYVRSNGGTSVTRCTLLGHEGDGGTSGLSSGYVNTPVVLDHCVIAFGENGQAITGPAELSCCDIYGNDGGDWTEQIADQNGVNGNFSSNPFFCFEHNPDAPYSLSSMSPCAAENNPECGQIGAWPVGCCITTATEATSWGKLKAMY